jgi:peptide/nickel transport system substrate-binding protein
MTIELSRRHLLASALGAGLASLPTLRTVRAQDGARAPELAIDLANEPATLDPALVYEADGWSIVHSVYDSLVQWDSDGQLQPLLAESFEQVDPLVWEFRLREGIAFHNGEPFDAASVAFSVAHIQDPETKSQVAGNFSVIESVEEVGPLTVRLNLSAPAPWLPAQIAAWLAMLPPVYAADPANDFANNPVGTGPYRFAGWARGSELRVEANPDYFTTSPKGVALADVVRFRPVAEPSTRVADLLSGSSGIIRSVPVDQVAAVEREGATVIAEPLSGFAIVRIPTDVAPFDNVLVRQAMNYAIDVETIVGSLLDGNGVRLPSIFVPGGMGWDPDLKPYPHDPEKAMALLQEAGFGKGFDTALAFATIEREDIVAAIAGQLEVVGIRAALQPTEVATFNATWKDPAAPPLRFLTWRPMFDPFTALNLLFNAEGFLSRYQNPNAQKLIQAGAGEPDVKIRNDIYRDLSKVLRDEPAGIYLYQLTGFYGVAADLPPWSPRADDYIIPTTLQDR